MNNKNCAPWQEALRVDRNGVNGVHASQDHIHSPRFGRRPNAQLCTASTWLTCGAEDRQTSPIHGLQLLLGRKRVVLLEQLIKPACTRTQLGSHVHRSLLPHVHSATGSQKVAMFMQLRSSCCVQLERQRTLAGETQWAGPAAHVTTPSWLTSRVCKACVKRVRALRLRLTLEWSNRSSCDTYVSNHCETRTLMKSVLFMGSLRDLFLYPSSTSDTLICMYTEAEGQAKLAHVRQEPVAQLCQIWLPLTHLVVLVLVQLYKVVKQHQDILNAWAAAFAVRLR